MSLTKEEWRHEVGIERSYSDISAALGAVKHYIWSLQGDLTDPNDFRAVDCLLESLQSMCADRESREERYQLFKHDKDEFLRTNDLRLNAQAEFNKALDASRIQSLVR